MEFLKRASTLSEIKKHIERHGSMIRMTLHSENSENFEIIEEFKHLLKEKREKMNPMFQNMEYMKLLDERKKMITKGLKGIQLSELNAEISRQTKMMQKDNEYITYSKVMDALQKLLPSAGGKIGSNRARRAFMADDIIQYDRTNFADAALDHLGVRRPQRARLLACEQGV